MWQRTRWGIGVPLVAATAILVTGMAASASNGRDLPGFGPGRDYHPAIEPADFGPNVDNPWFPLTPGTTLVYAGERDGTRTSELVTPLPRTTVIDGVRTASSSIACPRREVRGTDLRLLRAGRRRQRLVLRRGHRYARRQRQPHRYRGKLPCRRRRCAARRVHAGAPRHRSAVPARVVCGSCRRPVPRGRSTCERDRPVRRIPSSASHRGDHGPRAGRRRQQVLRAQRRRSIGTGSAGWYRAPRPRSRRARARDAPERSGGTDCVTGCARSPRARCGARSCGVRRGPRRSPRARQSSANPRPARRSNRGSRDRRAR